MSTAKINYKFNIYFLFRSIIPNILQKISKINYESNMDQINHILINIMHAFNQYLCIIYNFKLYVHDDDDDDGNE